MNINPFNPAGANLSPEKLHELQSKMETAKQKLSAIVVEGKSGVADYSVKVYLNGNYEATKVEVSENLLKHPVKIINDLVASAITDAAHQAKTAIQSEMFSLMQGFNPLGSK